MSKEIKFRTWDRVNKKMGRLIKLTWDKDGNLNPPFDYSEIIHDDGSTYNGLIGADFIVMQYTGIKDATGVEIYEGDIILFTFKTAGVHFTYKGKVIFEQFMFLVEIENGDCFSLNRISAINLLGNIHENPELLKQ